jgi:hypothetical protein
MNARPPLSSDPEDDRSRRVLDRQLEMLERLAEVGLGIAESIGRQVAADAESPAEALSEPGRRAAVLGASASAFARVSRAVRQTIALQSKLISDRQAFEAGVVKDLAQAAKDREIRRIWDKPRQIERAERMVWRIAAEENPDDLETAERLATEAAEQLKDEDLYGDILTRPFSEIVAEICLDLGLEPDWNSLSREAWAQSEMAGGDVGEPLANVLARKITPFPHRGARESPPPFHGSS